MSMWCICCMSPRSSIYLMFLDCEKPMHFILSTNTFLNSWTILGATRSLQGLNYYNMPLQYEHVWGTDFGKREFNTGLDSPYTSRETEYMGEMVTYNTIPPPAFSPPHPSYLPLSSLYRHYLIGGTRDSLTCYKAHIYSMAAHTLVDL